MYLADGVMYSSFLPKDEQPGGITDDFQVITSLRPTTPGISHVSLFIEMTEPTVEGGFSNLLLHLQGGNEGTQPIIEIKFVQLWSPNSGFENNSFHSKKTPEQMLVTAHHCYISNAARSERLIQASRRFQDKAKGGRYHYYRGGGVQASLKSALTPGVRGINCGDFVIKVLKEAGIATIPRRYTSSPERVVGV